MAAADITAARLRELLDYNPDTGIFKWRVKRGPAKPGDTAGCLCKRNGYVVICVDRKLYGAHRLAWLHVHGEWPAGEIDHRFGRRSDNRIRLLRDASTTFNRENLRKPHRDSTSGYLGVSWSKARQKWVANICSQRKQRRLGFFDEPAEAHAAYIAEKRRIHAGNTL